MPGPLAVSLALILSFLVLSPLLLLYTYHGYLYELFCKYFFQSLHFDFMCFLKLRIFAF